MKLVFKTFDFFNSSKILIIFLFHFRNCS